MKHILVQAAQTKRNGAILGIKEIELLFPQDSVDEQEVACVVGDILNCDIFALHYSEINDDFYSKNWSDAGNGIQYRTV